MPVSFRIISVSAQEEAATIEAELFRPGHDFVLTSGSFLGGAALSRTGTGRQPQGRDLGFGRQHYYFKLSHQADVAAFRAGAVVDLIPGNGLYLLHPWAPVYRDAVCLEQALGRETGRSHCLYGCRLRAIARHQYLDLVLFALDQGPAAYAVVQLGWTAQRQPDPLLPRTSLFPDWISVYEQQILPDYRNNL